MHRARLIEVTLSAALALATAAGGCGGGDDETDTSALSFPTQATTSAVRPTNAAPAPLEACKAAGQGWRPLRVSGPYASVAARLGHGETGVVFANDSIDDSCEWTHEAHALAERGYAAAVFLRGGGNQARQALTVGDALLEMGAQRIVLIGASLGARAVLQAGAEHPRGVAGLVALSAERRISSDPTDLLSIARDVRVPVLSVGSRGDALTRSGKDTLAWDRTLPDDRLLLVGGRSHGVHLLAGDRGPRVRAEILLFLRSL